MPLVTPELFPLIGFFLIGIFVGIIAWLVVIHWDTDWSK